MHASNFSNVVYDDIELCDYTSQEPTQLYYTEIVNKDWMIKKELLKITNMMNIKPKWCQEDTFEFQFLGFVSMNKNWINRGHSRLDPLLYTTLKKNEFQS